MQDVSQQETGRQEGSSLANGDQFSGQGEQPDANQQTATNVQQADSTSQQAVLILADEEEKKGEETTDQRMSYAEYNSQDALAQSAFNNKVICIDDDEDGAENVDLHEWGAE